MVIWKHLHLFWLIKDNSEHRVQQKEWKGVGKEDGRGRGRGSGGQKKRREDNIKKKTEDRD